MSVKKFFAIYSRSSLTAVSQLFSRESDAQTWNQMLNDCHNREKYAIAEVKYEFDPKTGRPHHKESIPADLILHPAYTPPPANLVRA